MGRMIPAKVLERFNYFCGHFLNDRAFSLTPPAGTLCKNPPRRQKTSKTVSIALLNKGESSICPSALQSHKIHPNGVQKVDFGNRWQLALAKKLHKVPENIRSVIAS